MIAENGIEIENDNFTLEESQKKSMKFSLHSHSVYLDLNLKAVFVLLDREKESMRLLLKQYESRLVDVDTATFVT